MDVRKETGPDAVFCHASRVFAGIVRLSMRRERQRFRILGTAVVACNDSGYPPNLGCEFCLPCLSAYSGVVRDRDYAVMLIGTADKVIHRSCIAPAYSRWPFTKPDHYQTNSTWIP